MDFFTFTIEKNNYAIPMSLIFEIIKAPEIVSSKNFPNFEGFINHRNMIYPVALFPESAGKNIKIIILLCVKNEVIGLGIDEIGQMDHTNDIQKIDTLGKSSSLAVVDKKVYYIIDPLLDLPSYDRTFENDITKLKPTGS